MGKEIVETLNAARNRNVHLAEFIIESQKNCSYKKLRNVCRNNGVYIHFGSKVFDINGFKPIKNQKYITFKPDPESGLWGSLVGSTYGWYDLCKEFGFDDFRWDFNNSFIFKLKDDARVAHLYTDDDLFSLPERENSPFCDYGWYAIDYEESCKLYDAIQLHINSVSSLEYLFSAAGYLYDWDCESIFVMNPDVIEPLEHNYSNFKNLLIYASKL